MTTYGPMVREFLRDRLAVTGVIILLVLFGVAALAPFIAPDARCR